MGFCTQCGNQISSNEKNCHYCGAVNEGYVPPKVEPKQAAQDYNARQENHMEAQKFAGLKYAEERQKYGRIFAVTFIVHPAKAI